MAYPINYPSTDYDLMRSNLALIKRDDKLRFSVSAEHYLWLCGGMSRSVLDILNPVAPAVENLACHQEQCDQDGVMVKVSRQALDEVLEVINKLAIASAQDVLSLTSG